MFTIILITLTYSFATKQQSLKFLFTKEHKKKKGAWCEHAVLFALRYSKQKLFFKPKNKQKERFLDNNSQYVLWCTQQCATQAWCTLNIIG